MKDSVFTCSLGLLYTTNRNHRNWGFVRHGKVCFKKILIKARKLLEDIFLIFFKWVVHKHLDEIEPIVFVPSNNFYSNTDNRRESGLIDKLLTFRYCKHFKHQASSFFTSFVAKRVSFARNNENIILLSFHFETTTVSFLFYSISPLYYIILDYFFDHYAAYQIIRLIFDRSIKIISTDRVNFARIIIMISHVYQGTSYYYKWIIKKSTCLREIFRKT